MTYLLMVSLSSLVFELGRKVRLPEEEIAGVPSYSSTLGRAKAITLIRSLGFISICVGALLLWLMGAEGGTLYFGLETLSLLCFYCACGILRTECKASKVETAGSLFLLLQLLACIVGSLGA